MPDQQGRDRRSGLERLRGALRRPARNQLVVALILAVVGFAGITQIRANEVDDSYSGLREQDLIDVLEGLAGTTQRTQDRIDRLTRTRSQLRSDSSRREAALRQAEEEADALSVLAGLDPVTGPGIRITITETGQAVSVSNMLDLVQQLRTSGAEAMQVNGEVRVVAATAFSQTAEGLVVDGTQLSSPYVLDVIGPPVDMAGAVDFALGPRRELREIGADPVVEELSSLDIDSVRESTSTDYAEPAPDQ